MLPFLKKKDSGGVAGMIMKTRTPDETAPAEDTADDSSAAIEACAQELVRAIHSHDAKAVAAALKDAFTILESMPEETEDNSFEAQNEKAAKNAPY